ncbi:MAG: cupin domain-containing protein, partial [Solirubrobacterales bacterium]|nr:cupin domain-containing protein [Solirubrobacterales bacterium]
GTRLGPRLGAEQLGATLFELDPGGQAAPYHAHFGNEELLLVLEGELELRTPEGKRNVVRGELVAFRTGAEGAHRLRNISEHKARYLMISTMRFPEVAEQLDTGTILAIKGPSDGWAFPSGSSGDYVSLTLAALEAEPE